MSDWWHSQRACTKCPRIWAAHKAQPTCLHTRHTVIRPAHRAQSTGLNTRGTVNRPAHKAHSQACTQSTTNNPAQSTGLHTKHTVNRPANKAHSQQSCSQGTFHRAAHKAKSRGLQTNAHAPAQLCQHCRLRLNDNEPKILAVSQKACRIALGSA